jgi:hypothetical protein
VQFCDFDAAKLKLREKAELRKLVTSIKSYYYGAG